MKSLVTFCRISSFAVVTAYSFTALSQGNAAEKPVARATKSTTSKVVAKPSKVTVVSKPPISVTRYTNPCFIAPDYDDNSGYDESAIDVYGILLPALDDELMYWYWLPSE